MVSVIIPCYNSAEFIGQTISSVLSQTVSEIEVIVIDDVSSDNTADIVKEFSKKDGRIRYLLQDKRRGVSAARNRGISESRGAFIAFIDHDDLWLQTKLEKQLRLYNLDPKVSLVFSRESILLPNGMDNQLFGGFGKPLRGYVFKELFDKHFIPLSTVVIKREVFDSLNEWFIESMEMAEEIELFLRIAFTWKVDYCEEILAKWRSHERNDSKLRFGLMAHDYSLILERLRKNIPNFDRDYKKQIRTKERWIAATEIKVLMSQDSRNLARVKFFKFLKSFGVCFESACELPALFILGFQRFERLRMHCIDYYNFITRPQNYSPRNSKLIP